MSHRVALYTVRVYPRYQRNADRPLGNIDRSGTRLAETLHGYFKAGVFQHANDDGTRMVICESSDLVHDQVRAMFAAGQSGMVAQIIDANQQLRLRQEVDDTQLVRCASLFRLTRNEALGWWAVHVNHGRSAKGLVQTKVQEMFKDSYGGLTLKVEPWVRGEVYAQLVQEGRVDSLTLARWERPSDRADNATGKWVKDKDQVAKVELRVKGRDRLKTGLLKRFFNGEHAVFKEIVTFEGMTFDEARIEVEMENGDHRTVNIESPEAGHPYTVELDEDELTFDGGEPTAESLFVSMESVLDDLT